MVWIMVGLFFHKISGEADGLSVVSGAPQSQDSESASHVYSCSAPQDCKMAAAAPCITSLYLKLKAERFFLLYFYYEREKSFLEAHSTYLISLGKQESRVFSFYFVR